MNESGNIYIIYMRTFVYTLGVLCWSVLSVACKDSNTDAVIDYSALVNPFIGTDFTGNTYPGAQAPFGMVQLSPDNGLPGWDRIAGYYYPDSTIAGFSHTHLSGTGAGDLYDISFMPVMLPYNEAEAPLGIYSKFSHDDEEASAGYYRVKLKDYDIDVELTATERAGVQRYTFPEGEGAVILNLRKAMNWDKTLDTRLEVIDSVTVAGYRYSTGWARDQRTYFYTKFSRPWDSVSIDKEAIADGAGDEAGESVIAMFHFKTMPGEQIVITTALSGVNIDGAELNHKSEVSHFDFDRYVAEVKRQWNEQLGVIDITTDNHDDAVTFYTALYHTMIAPTIFSDVNGKYRGPDNKIHVADGWVDYSTFSLWDTFRAAHPLLTYTQPQRVNDMIKSFLAFYEQNGRLPVWNFQGVETDMMIGYHAVPVIVDAYLKGIGDFDAQKALDACVASANIDEYRGIGEYKQKGYISYDVTDPYNSDNWSLSRTLEYAYDDYCIAKMAEKMGRKEIADEFYRRSRNYKNVFNPAIGFMQPRDSLGGWQPNFTPDEYTQHICESNGWQYLWSVQQDIPDLIEMIGGEEKFSNKLDSMFTYTPADSELPIFSTGMIGQYAHGNEPGHHVIYLYNKIGQPWKSAEYAAKVMRDFYFNAPDGLCGNEDCGQMSAWYVFSAMGFYPVDPVSGQYELGTPIAKETRIKLADGKQFVVKAHNLSKENIYIKSVKVDGKDYNKSYITHDMIEQGCIVELEMTSESGQVWY